MDRIDEELFSIINQGVNPSVIVVSISFWKEIKRNKEIYTNGYGDTFYKNLHLYVNPKLKEGFYFKQGEKHKLSKERNNYRMGRSYLC